MNNVLLVDDEAFIVEGLYHVFSRLEAFEFLVWKALSALEGIEIMQKNRIDILITDVRMPGMNGIEFVRLVREQWPRCKVIFLSGYSDYEYLQSALRHEAFDYLLKPVSDNTMIDALRRVIRSIESDIQAQDVMLRAEAQLQKAEQLLRKDFYEQLLHGLPLGRTAVSRLLESLQIGLDAGRSLIIVMGRVDRWPKGLQTRDKLLLQYAIDNIVKEYVSQSCRIEAFTEGVRNVWFIQAPDHVKNDYDAELKKLHLYISELLEKIQEAIQQYLQLTVSFVISSLNADWPDIQQHYKQMFGLLQRGIGLDEQIVLAEPAKLSAQSDQAAMLPQDVRKSMNQLNQWLVAGDRTAFMQELLRIFGSVQKSVYLDYSLQMELYTNLSAMFLSFMNARKIASAIGRSIDLDYLCNYSKHANWQALEEYFRHLSELLFSFAEGETKDQKSGIIERIDAYIAKSLSQNLSLDHLARLVHLSPYYLSRLYHAEKGISLSEQIKQLRLSRAKELLLKGSMKIQDVAVELGFENVSYFAKFFKKHVGVTPREYKTDSHVLEDDYFC